MKPILYKWKIMTQLREWSRFSKSDEQSMLYYRKSLQQYIQQVKEQSKRPEQKQVKAISRKLCLCCNIWQDYVHIRIILKDTRILRVLWENYLQSKDVVRELLACHTEWLVFDDWLCQRNCKILNLIHFVITFLKNIIPVREQELLW